MCAWRLMLEKLRCEILDQRKLQKRPWHSPPDWRSDRTDRYLFTAACFEHKAIIGHSAERLVDYIHHNPVQHGLVRRWQNRPFSSASDFLEKFGRTEAEKSWKEYPVGEYGQGWDD